MIATGLLLAQLAAASACVPAPHAPELDHAIVAVRDLDAASDAFRRVGFRIKPGRPHANGLLNAHIKFRDGTELELMTVQGSARDAMARDYAALIAEADGGVYVALRIDSLARVRHAADAASLDVVGSASGAWQFASFLATSSAAAIFFTEGGGAVQDPDSIFEHEPAAHGLEEVWLEGGAELETLLQSLGAAPCDVARGPDGVIGRRWILKRGSLVIVPARAGVRPRVLGVVLAREARSGELRRPIASFWVAGAQGGRQPRP